MSITIFHLLKINNNVLLIISLLLFTITNLFSCYFLRIAKKKNIKTTVVKEAAKRSIPVAVSRNG